MKKTGPQLLIDDYGFIHNGTLAPTAIKYLYPAVNLRRVHGAAYTPYSIKYGEWAKKANRVLADHARSNFERGKR